MDVRCTIQILDIKLALPGFEPGSQPFYRLELTDQRAIYLTAVLQGSMVLMNFFQFIRFWESILCIKKFKIRIKTLL